MPKSKIVNVIVAAGSGTRFGSDLPKQFCKLNGITVLQHAVNRLRGATADAPTIVVVSPEYEHLVPEDCRVVYGGATRSHSVRNALSTVAALEPEIVLIHDGARPLPSRQLVESVIDACQMHHGAIPAIAVTDTLRRIDGQPVNRADFRAVQTPQGFRADLLLEAYQKAERDEFTDDASVMSAAGFTDIVMTEGSPTNIKITHPVDLKIAGLYLAHES